MQGESLAEVRDLTVQRAGRPVLGGDEDERRLTARDGRPARHQPQALALLRAGAVEGDRLGGFGAQTGRQVGRNGQFGVPQRTRRESVRACARNLEVDAGIRLEEALVGGGAVETDFAVWANLRCSNHRIEDILELLIEILDNRGGEDAIECEAATE